MSLGCTHLSKHFSAVHSVVNVCARDNRLFKSIFSKFLSKFRNVSKHTVSRSSLSCNQNIKEDIPTAFGVLLCFETKRNDINRSCTKKNPRNTRAISAEELGSLVRGPVWGTHSLTFIFSSANSTSFFAAAERKSKQN